MKPLVGGETTYLLSSGMPEACHSLKPPRRALAFLNPLFKRMSAAPALECSSVQVQ
ncbi:MAG: hypothetical protein HYV24_09075 [Deltaproteobacteria bacterium]|nr:hypothetical protein [Deltaproteobacteria bacterium]